MTSQFAVVIDGAPTVYKLTYQVVRPCGFQYARASTACPDVRRDESNEEFPDCQSFSLGEAALETVHERTERALDTGVTQEAFDLTAVRNTGEGRGIGKQRSNGQQPKAYRFQ